MHSLFHEYETEFTKPLFFPDEPRDKPCDEQKEQELFTKITEKLFLGKNVDLSEHPDIEEVYEYLSKWEDVVRPEGGWDLLGIHKPVDELCATFRGISETLISALDRLGETPKNVYDTIKKDGDTILTMVGSFLGKHRNNIVCFLAAMLLLEMAKGRIAPETYHTFKILFVFFFDEIFFEITSQIIQT